MKKAARGEAAVKAELQTKPAVHGGSIRLEARKLDHRAPFVGFVRNELGEVGGRAWQHNRGKLGKPLLDLGIGEAGIGLLIALGDDLGRGVLRRTQAELSTRLEAR